MTEDKVVYHDETELDKQIRGFLEYLEVERNCSPLTIRNYRHYLRAYSSWVFDEFHDGTMKVLNAETIRKYRLHLARYSDPNGSPLSRSTQSYYVIALRSFLKWLIRNDYRVVAPEKIDLPKAESHSLRFLNSEQMGRLLSQPVVSTAQGLRDRAILEILFSTGLRVSELVKLDREKIDLKRKEFGVIGKGRRPRVVFLSSSAVSWIERYLTSRTDRSSALFIRINKNAHKNIDQSKLRLSCRSIQRIVEKYVRKAKLPIHATPHSIRHSFATDLLMAGADIRSVQEMLGHKNISTTQIYTHVTNRQLRTVHQAFHGKSK